jgi:hypothetical protein
LNDQSAARSCLFFGNLRKNSSGFPKLLFERPVNTLPNRKFALAARRLILPFFFNFFLLLGDLRLKPVHQFIDGGV